MPVRPAYRKGPVVNEKEFSAWLEGESPLHVGVLSNLRAVVKPKPGFHVNADYPSGFVPRATSASVRFPVAIVSGLVVRRNHGVLPIPLTPTASGSFQVKGEFSFGLCTDAQTKCHRRAPVLALDLESR